MATPHTVTRMHIHVQVHMYLELLVLFLEVFVLVGVAVGELVDVDVVVADLVQNVRLHLANLGARQRVGLGNHRHDVDLVVQALHEVNVDLTQSASNYGSYVRHPLLLKTSVSQRAVDVHD